MNPQPELQSDSLRSDIDHTRERMDNTIDQLGNRLGGRHLVDELIGFFRGRNSAGTGSQVGERISHAAETAVHSVVDTVKAHPIPTVMIGAGIAWLIYETRNGKSRRTTDALMEETDYTGYTEYSAGGYEAADYGTDLQEETGGIRSKASEVTAQAKAKLGELGEKTRQQVSRVQESGREKLQSAKERIGHFASDAQARSREAYDRARERVVSTADQHPLELGLGCLAAGLIIGLMLPTPQVVNRRLGPTVDRLKDRTRDAGSELLEKGKRVVQAATNAAKVEAKTQGLSVAKLRDQGSSSEAQPESAGLAAGPSGGPGQQDRPADPSAARPAV